MAKSQVLHRQAPGVATFPNVLDALPGSLQRAENATVRKSGVLARRRGYERYMALSAPATALGTYLKRLVVLDGTTLKYDSDGLGTPASWPGSFIAPTGERVNFLDAQEALYFTTLKGVWKQDSLAGTPRRSGMPRAIDLDVALSGTGQDWHTPDTNVGYKATWKRIDANGRSIIGATCVRRKVSNPSTAVTLTHASGVVTVTHAAHGYSTGDVVTISNLSDAGFGNSGHVVTVTGAGTYTYTDGLASPGASATGRAGKVFRATLTVVVPPDIVSGDYLQIWRTERSANLSTDPGDEHFLVEEKKYTSGATVTYVDTIDEALLGEPLYSNPNEETSLQENDRPPHALYLALWKRHVWYASVLLEQILQVQLNSLSGISTVPGSEDSVTITAGAPLTYKFSTAEDVAARKFRLYTTADPSTPTLSQAIEETARSLARVANQDSASSVTISYASRPDDPPGILVLRARDLNGEKIRIQASAGAGDDFLPDITTEQVSAETRRLNAIMNSKADQPEHVPAFNIHTLGSASAAILWVVPSRDALFVGKEDGIYKVTGESDGRGGLTFAYSEVDRTVQAIGPGTAQALDNSVFFVSNQGVVRLNESGSGITSWQIEDDLRRLVEGGNFSSIGFALADESEQSYHLFCGVDGDSRVTGSLLYPYIARGWTVGIKKPVSAAVVIGQRKYLAHRVDSYVLRERRSFSSTGIDYVDEDVPATVTASSTTLDADGNTVSTVDVTYTYLEPIAVGWLFESELGGASGRDHAEGFVEAVAALGGTSYRLTLDRLLTVANGAATMGMAIPFRAEWLPEDAGNAAVLKHYPAVQIYLASDGALHHRLGFQADHQASMAYTNTIAIDPPLGWGNSEWGSSEWGSLSASRRSTPPRVLTPINHARARTLRLYYENLRARERVEILQVSFDVRSTGSRTQRLP